MLAVQDGRAGDRVQECRAARKGTSGGARLSLCFTPSEPAGPERFETCSLTHCVSQLRGTVTQGVSLCFAVQP